MPANSFKCPSTIKSVCLIKVVSFTAVTSLNIIETLSNKDDNEDDNGIRQWPELQNRINTSANEQSCKKTNRILQNYNVKSLDFTLCRELEDAKQFISARPETVFHFMSFENFESKWQFRRKLH